MEAELVSNPNYSSAENEFDYYQGMDDTTLFEQLPMDYFDDLDFHSLVSDSPNHQNPQSIIIAPPPAPTPNKSATTSKLISFEQSNNNNNNNAHRFYNNLGSNDKLETPKEESVLNFQSLSRQGAYFEDINKRLTATNMADKAETRNPPQAQDHVLAERRRREKLNQKFIALSSVIPGRKKMDKASVLEDAIEYVKQLKERQKILEEQVAMKRKESAVRRCILFSGDNDKSPSGEVSEQALAELEAKFLGKEVMIRIQCEQQRGCEAKILRELGNLRLTVKSSSILPFGETTQYITIIAEMEKENSMTANDLVTCLMKALTLFQ
ncbi:hypothetical protein QN277_003381 [Acacia crassicarpa]|uniref:BHLH domain-containing protein n=1 Tax=Acacia crassicarpa TaxID=499986 RepID=A0AAE1IZB8_9FABA|nr:hypothetical protein QN277_003381 [Acacia crassicarpa]